MKKLQPFETKVDESLIEELKNRSLLKFPINGNIIKQKAQEIAKKNSVKEFKTGNGWLNSFSKRNNVKFKTQTGTKVDVSENEINEIHDKFKDKLFEYNAENILNTDETALFYQKLPVKSYVFPNDYNTKLKELQERITILLTCATGEKVKPLFIGKCLKPHCFKNIDISEQESIS
ncbi:tigger transposable element-derived protein 4-like [Octopus bimaculoides]|uniref:tigger transposable element-derived protein 4-like n=1 Tax=Octopus bimaculoides TaxID=37653 RepID=UPI00071C221E|nr:tigger transposable element-derived protein 4-like [Octopus bimaculoides]|eukprot:XP_014781986.1 PREDICTED: tigger transposable element-derived protein 4-like [Octopus bimaculoides]